jgi:hypothetical protein
LNPVTVIAVGFGSPVILFIFSTLTGR